MLPSSASYSGAAVSARSGSGVGQVLESARRRTMPLGLVAVAALTLLAGSRPVNAAVASTPIRASTAVAQRGRGPSRISRDGFVGRSASYVAKPITARKTSESWSQWFDGLLDRNRTTLAWIVIVVIGAGAVYILREGWRRRRARVAFDAGAAENDQRLAGELRAYLWELKEKPVRELGLDVGIGPGAVTPFPDLTKLNEQVGVVEAVARWIFQPTIYTFQLRMLPVSGQDEACALILRNAVGQEVNGATVDLSALSENVGRAQRTQLLVPMIAAWLLLACAKENLLKPQRPERLYQSFSTRRWRSCAYQLAGSELLGREYFEEAAAVSRMALAEDQGNQQARIDLAAALTRTRATADLNSAIREVNRFENANPNTKSALWYRAEYTGSVACLQHGLPSSHHPYGVLRFVGEAYKSSYDLLLQLLTPGPIGANDAGALGPDDGFQGWKAEIRQGFRASSAVLLAGAVLLNARLHGHMTSNTVLGTGNPRWWEMRQVLERHRDDPLGTNADALVHLLGDPELLDPRARYNLVCYLALAGHRDAAIEQLEAIVPWNHSLARQARQDPALNLLRGQARFERLVLNTGASRLTRILSAH